MKGYVVGNVASKGMDPHRVHLESFWRAAKVPDSYHSIFEVEILDDGTTPQSSCSVACVAHHHHHCAVVDAQSEPYPGTGLGAVSNCLRPIPRQCICLWYSDLLSSSPFTGQMS
jgi:hypothetical protein